MATKPDDTEEKTGEIQTPNQLHDDSVSPAGQVDGDAGETTSAPDQEPSGAEPSLEASVKREPRILIPGPVIEAGPPSFAERQKQLMAHADRMEQKPDDGQAIQGLVNFLADPDSPLRWLAGLALKHHSSREVIVALAEFLDQDPGETARSEALKVLEQIASTSKDGGVQDSARQLLSRT